MFQSLGQSLGSEFGVRVSGLSLEFASKLKLKSEFGARVWSLGPSLGPKSGVRVRVWVRVWGQSLESGSEFGSEFGGRVWSLELEVRV